MQLPLQNPTQIVKEEVQDYKITPTTLGSEVEEPTSEVSQPSRQAVVMRVCKMSKMPLANIRQSCGRIASLPFFCLQRHARLLCHDVITDAGAFTKIAG